MARPKCGQKLGRSQAEFTATIAASALGGFVEFDRQPTPAEISSEFPLTFDFDEATDRRVAREAIRNAADRFRSFQPRFAFGFLHVIARIKKAAAEAAAR